MNTTVFYHSADFDGLFCREIARKFLPPDTTFIGWNFGDPVQPIPSGVIYVLDLPVDRIFGFDFNKPLSLLNVFADPNAMKQANDRIIWIDHHKSSIESHPKEIPGYRIDGVSACRLAWQYFEKWSKDAITISKTILPSKQDFIDRKVEEPLAVRLAGEYDIWDKRDPDAELFQHGLRSEPLTTQIWKVLLSYNGGLVVERLLAGGRVLQLARANEYRDVITSQGFDVDFEGLTFLACNSHEADIRSQLFKDGIKSHHHALLGFTWTGLAWRVSMYQIDGLPHDIIGIAKKFGGGGHAGACGFHTNHLPFLT